MIFRLSIALAVTIFVQLLMSTPVVAQTNTVWTEPAEIEEGVLTDGDCCDDGSCNPCCRSCYNCDALFGSAELTFFRYHRADGVRVGTSPANDEVEFDFDVAPRVTVGYKGDDGLVLRTRWWNYDHDASRDEYGSNGSGEFLDVDTFTLDFEVADVVCLSDCWTLELSGGIRYNEFDETFVDNNGYETRHVSFQGAGGVAGVQANRRVCTGHMVFSRIRGAILMDDKLIQGTYYETENEAILRDTTQGMMELALGYEAHWCIGCDTTVFARGAGEWQNWYNYSNSFGDLGSNNFSNSPSDVGFGGFTFALGILR